MNQKVSNFQTPILLYNQHSGDVEGFARGVVERLAEKLVAAELLHLHDLGVAAGDEKREKREFGGGIRKTGREKMSLKMMHAEHAQFFVS